MLSLSTIIEEFTSGLLSEQPYVTFNLLHLVNLFRRK
jgi:hypothetical protein